MKSIPASSRALEYKRVDFCPLGNDFRGKRRLVETARRAVSWSLYISNDARRFATTVDPALRPRQAWGVPLRRSAGSIARGERFLRTPGGGAAPRPPLRK